jgi:hypothetical protein
MKKRLNSEKKKGLDSKKKRLDSKKKKGWTVKRERRQKILT